MIAEQDVQGVIDLVKAKGLSEELVGELRQRFNDYHFTYCMDDDMDAHVPAMELGEFNIYFVDSSNSCAKLTRDSERASGFVLAEVIDD